MGLRVRTEKGMRDSSGVKRKPARNDGWGNAGAKPMAAARATGQENRGKKNEGFAEKHRRQNTRLTTFGMTSRSIAQVMDAERSRHVGFFVWISATFFERRHDLISFSRAIALKAVP